jgi:hypothetical protein
LPHAVRTPFLYLLGLAVLASCPTAATAESEDPPPERAWLTDVTAAWGLDFVHDPALAGDYFIPESIGSGAALLDYDGDGDLDLYLVDGARHGGDAADDPGPAPADRLYRRGSDGRFADVTAAAGLGGAPTGYGMGVAVGDVDGDGYPDLYLTRHGPDALYLNLGDGSFREATTAAGLGNPAWSSSAAFFDPDLDGDLDLYVATYLDFDRAAVCTDAAGRRDYCGPDGFTGPPDAFFRNRGTGPEGVRFEDASVASGVASRPGKSLGVVARDLDGDALPDLYVARDGEPNALWINRGVGPGGARFEDRALELGAAVELLGRPEAGMGVAAGDVDGDGMTDLLVTNLRAETNTLYRGLGEAGFADSTDGAGLAGPSLPYTGFGTALADLDQDGDLDALVANGRVSRGPLLTGREEAAGFWDAYAEPNQLFVNRGGARFEEDPGRGGAFSEAVETSRGLAAGDLDGDGDLDLLVTNAGGPARLFRNDAPRLEGGGSWLLVQVGGPGAPEVPGAEVTIAAGPLRLARTAARDGSFLSSQDPRAHFGLGGAAAVERLTVRWPGGGARVFLDLPVNRVLVVADPLRRGESR